MENVRIGLVGLGNMGKTHRANLRAGKVRGLQLTAICDQPIGLPAKEEGEHQFSDFQEMIASGTIDAVLIATPHFFHTTMGIAALEAGLHVMVENRSPFPRRTASASSPLTRAGRRFSVLCSNSAPIHFISS